MLSYSKFREQIANKETTSVDFTKQVLSKIDEMKHLNAFITVTDEFALSQAAESDKRFESNSARPLEGMIVAVKDNISTKDIKTTCASKMLENYVPVYNATAVDRLIEAGAIIIGKTNLDEFAMGSTNNTSYFGPVKNPLNEEYVPGGSSGGSAAAVAAGLCHVALGSDTGGSVRQPASFCGIYGFKPTYGRFSRYGLVAFASSLDQIGVFAANIDDVALVSDVISGPDEIDSTCVDMPKLNSYELLQDNTFNIQDLKIGILPPDSIESCDEEMKKVYLECIGQLKAAGATLQEVTFNFTSAWIPTYYIIATAEASSNLSRFDGIRFGTRPEIGEDEDLFTAVRSNGFGDEVKRRIMTGVYVLSSGYYDAYYKKAQQVRRIIYDNYISAFSDVDLIFMPTTPTTAFPKDFKPANPVQMYMADFYTASANLAGICGINIPVGFDSNNLPIGMQLQAQKFDDEKLILCAHKIKRMINS